MSRLLEFEKLHNIRDLGGMKTSDGRYICSGCFFRGGHLANVCPADRDKLQSMIDMIVDFRSVGEKIENPDIAIEGVSYIHIPIVDSLTAGISREKESDQNIIAKLALKSKDAKNYMCDMYRKFADEHAVRQYSEFVHLLLNNNGKRILWHCTAGKDRAGIASVIVEEILGVPRADIIKDYLMTNEYLKDDIVQLTEFVKAQAHVDSVLSDEALRYLFGADEEYIDSFYRSVDERYGSFDAFIRYGLRITEEESV